MSNGIERGSALHKVCGDSKITQDCAKNKSVVLLCLNGGGWADAKKRHIVFADLSGVGSGERSDIASSP